MSLLDDDGNVNDSIQLIENELGKEISDYFFQDKTVYITIYSIEDKEYLMSYRLEK